LAETSPEALVLPTSVKKGTLQTENAVRSALRYSAETARLGGIDVRVENGVVYLTGMAQSFDDIARVDETVSALSNVDRVHNELEVQD
jgi:osmotically-inducible protein OsmY